jgi:hypothetical protein
MKRWHEDFPRTLREWKKHYLQHVENNVNANQARQVGRDPYEIHGDKYPRREQTRQELLAELKFREGLADD